MGAEGVRHPLALGHQKEETFGVKRRQHHHAALRARDQAADFDAVSHDVEGRAGWQAGAVEVGDHQADLAARQERVLHGAIQGMRGGREQRPRHAEILEWSDGTRGRGDVAAATTTAAWSARRVSGDGGDRRGQ